MQITSKIKPTLLAISVLAAINSANAQETESTTAVNEAETEVTNPNAQTRAKKAKQEAEETEVIEVTGLRSSLLKATELKRTANNLIDVITAEDVGAFPDENVVESLQRVTGVQVIFGDNGSAGAFQVRGVSQNRIELNGRSVAGGQGGDPSRDVNLADFPAELIDSLEVIKSPTAALTEGSLGATINLKTKRPLRIKKSFINVNAKAKYGDEAEELFPNLNIIGTHSWRDTPLGDFGALVNLTYNDNHNGGDVVRTNQWQKRCPMYAEDNSGRTVLAQGRCNPEEGEITVYRARQFGLIDSNRQNTKTAIATTLQWKPTQDSSYTLDVIHNKADNMAYSDIMWIHTDTNWVLPAEELGPDGELYAFSDLKTGTEVERYDAMGRFVDTVLPATSYTSAIGVVNNVNAQAFPSETTQTTVALKGEWNFDRLGIEAEAAHSKSEHERHYVVARLNAYFGNPLNFNDQRYRIDDKSIVGTDQATAIRQNGSDLTVDLSDPRTIGLTLDTEGMDPNDMRYWRVASFGNDGWKRDPTSSAAKIDFDYDLDWGPFTTLEFGARVAQDYMENSTRFRVSCAGKWAWGTEEDQSVANSYDPKTDLDCQKPMSGVEFADQYPDLIKTHDGFYAEAGSVPSFSAIDLAVFQDDRERWNELSGFNDVGGYSESPGENYNLTEDTTALYVMTNLDGDLTSNLTYRGNFGIRAVKTEVKAETYNSVDENGDPKALISENDYTNYLPSMNFAIASDKYGLVRLAAAETMVRPALGKLLPVAQLNNFQGCVPYDPQDPFNVLPDNGVFPPENLPQDVRDKMIAQQYAIQNYYEGVTDTCPGIRSGTTNIGNINLVAQTSRNVDLSYERYWGKGNMFSLAFFHRKVEADTVTRRGVLAVPAEPGTTLVGVEGNGGETGEDILVGEDISAQPGYELWRIRTAFNGKGSTRQGIEIGYTQWLDFLPGFWQGFGFQANYTYSDGSRPDPTFIDKATELPLDLNALGITAGDFEGQRDALDALVAQGSDGPLPNGFDLEDPNALMPIQNMSEHSGNLSFFYDRNKLNARLAANYRSGYYKSGNRNWPLYSDSSTRLDFSSNYRINKKLKVQFNINNITKTKLHHYRIDRQITDRSSYSDRIYTVGINYRFD
ncbi:TonB-dependent receptor [Gayadomonas joobiniege]|uniref:TonB-dependent receptor n=1 Tax=Gayadomonas joobiniege TaxID=1234606 RepID=UPI0003743E17|nr:TonB-dependent receptor [Gayadomonas joobiniege]